MTPQAPLQLCSYWHHILHHSQGTSTKTVRSPCKKSTRKSLGIPSTADWTIVVGHKGQSGWGDAARGGRKQENPITLGHIEQQLPLHKLHSSRRQLRAETPARIFPLRNNVGGCWIQPHHFQHIRDPTGSKWSQKTTPRANGMGRFPVLQHEGFAPSSSPIGQRALTTYTQGLCQAFELAVPTAFLGKRRRRDAGSAGESTLSSQEQGGLRVMRRSS